MQLQTNQQSNQGNPQAPGVSSSNIISSIIPQNINEKLKVY